MYLSIICGMFGPQEIIIILVIVLLLFGGRKIPELMKGLGKGMKEFKNATKEDEEQPETKKDSEKNKEQDFD
ncbi:twin-arginine translocase TatA/TatE family subunit [uncultured Sunxiuqinia sp.]|uniref:twin-arginine translocase TatA/TatE family subunit n=1 Tax=uncultured Sunxiuqinia sp. TaxID=1573825 RepID=UPI003749CE6D